MLNHKFKAKQVIDDVIRFASKKEHKRYRELKLFAKYGEVLFFLRQVPFYLPANVKYLCDYKVFGWTAMLLLKTLKA